MPAPNYDCPDPYANPDYCDRCAGWGHLCPAWREAHPEEVGRVERVFLTGWDPARLYGSVAEARAGERRIARARQRD